MKKLLFILSLIFIFNLSTICYADTKYGWFFTQDNQNYEFVLKDTNYFINKITENTDLLKYMGARQSGDTVRIYAKDGLWLIDERLYYFKDYKLQFASEGSGYKIDSKTGQVKNNQNKYYTGTSTTTSSSGYNTTLIKNIMDYVGKLYANTKYSNSGNVNFTFNGKSYRGQRPDCSGMVGTIGAVYKVETNTLSYINNMNLEESGYRTSTGDMTNIFAPKNLSLSELRPGDVLTHGAGTTSSGTSYGAHAIMVYTKSGNTITFIEKTSDGDNGKNAFPININNIKIINGKVLVRNKVYDTFYRIK